MGSPTTRVYHLKQETNYKIKSNDNFSIMMLSLQFGKLSAGNSRAHPTNDLSFKVFRCGSIWCGIGNGNCHHDAIDIASSC